MAGHVPGKGHLVGHHDHGQAAGGQLAHDRQHFAHHLGVQGRGGLVKQQHLRLHGQGPGDGHPLLLAAGQLPGPGVDVRGHAHFFQVGQGGGLGRLLVLVQDIAQAGGAVFQHGHVVEQVERLEHHPHPGPVAAGVEPLGHDVLAVEEDGARRGGLQQVDAAQQGGLARPRCADDAGDVPGFDGKVHIPQHHVGAETLGEVAHFNDRFRHGWRPPSCQDSGTCGPGPGRCTSRWCRPGCRWCPGRSSGGRPAFSPTGAADSWTPGSWSDRSA